MTTTISACKDKIKCFFGMHNFGNWKKYGGRFLDGFINERPIMTQYYERFCTKCNKREETYD